MQSPSAIHALGTLTWVTRNLRAVQILLGHRKIENAVRYLGIDVEDALALTENMTCPPLAPSV